MKIEPVGHNVNVEQQGLVQKQVKDGVLEGMRKRVEREIQQTQQEAQESRSVKSEELQKLLEELKRKFDMLSKYLKIDIDTELEIPVAKIIEKDTNRVIRQIPPDYLLDLMKKIDQMLGILLQKEV
ncbi:flagellar protein FlaG [Pampinifervens florentissimum]|uniref:flagellar protein FlaG n=1 Tax=Pampinifervens florentissimum TaxID=1632019 RepID=UPI0013B48C6E|nr:flagellar protein FlaG [Hydrogenobacter sp. T-8]QID32924.1 flagellar biosynthesis protein FlaG [Hydrogenobacter sp. T-8]